MTTEPTPPAEPDDERAVVRATVNSLPFPDPEDPVAEGAAAIRALAESIEIATGNVTFPNTTSGSASVTVTFPAGLFTKAPFVVAQASGSYLHVGTGAGTLTGVTLVAVQRTPAGASTGVSNGNARWIACAIY